MYPSADELLLYAGLALAGAALVIAVVAILVFVIRKLRLDARFDEEYGKKRQA